jgi:RNA polymerase sigma-70 factor (ECF subfamily)
LENPLEQAADLALAERAREGDEAAFAEIVRRYSPRVFRVASRFFRRRNDVEDAAQEIFLRAYTRLADFEGRGSMEGWLTRIATTTCLNLLRDSQRRPEATLSDMPEGAHDWLENQLADVSAERHRSTENNLVAADLADRVLATLSPDDRLALLLVDGAETPIKQVAEMTGWSESKVKVQAFRARRRMREALERLLAGKRRGAFSEECAGSEEGAGSAKGRGEK